MMKTPWWFDGKELRKSMKMESAYWCKEMRAQAENVSRVHLFM
jgi:hypothetical protein